MESSIQTENRAAAWLARRDSGNWTEDDARALEAWLGASTANTVAFIRLEAAWNEAERLKALGAGRVPSVIPVSGHVHRDAREVAGRTERRSTRAVLLGLAASVLVVIAAGTGYFLSVGPTYRTPVGGIASVPMTDGSKITLNTDSAIRITVSDKERRVQLDRGEAFFEVAKDRNRPFIVTAGNKRVIAVGTKFSVRRDGDDVRVFVTEGKVRFEGAEEAGSAARRSQQFSVPVAAGEASGSGEVFLTAGAVARATENSVLVQTRTLPAVEEYLSWRTGYLVFHDTTLADAVGEFNRYNDHKIVIQDSAVAAIQLSGKFRSTNFEAFVRLLEDGFPIHAQRADDRIILTDSTKAP